jgi:hypothetical protein
VRGQRAGRTPDRDQRGRAGENQRLRMSLIHLLFSINKQTRFNHE